jgi:hypothetical protein
VVEQDLGERAARGMADEDRRGVERADDGLQVRDDSRDREDKDESTRFPTATIAVSSVAVYGRDPGRPLTGPLAAPRGRRIA